MYEFENRLSIQFPQNNHIKDKIRQQLQILRDQNMIEFIGRGLYKKINKLHPTPKAFWFQIMMLNSQGIFIVD